MDPANASAALTLKFDARLRGGLLLTVCVQAAVVLFLVGRREGRVRSAVRNAMGTVPD